MAKFFINRPIVAIVIAILMVIAGVVAMLSLPTAQFPNIADPQIQVIASYTGADAQTVAQSVATPIEQQMSGVDNMNYMYSLNASNGQMTLTVDSNIDTVSSIDQILTQMRVSQANSQLPAAVLNQGVTVQKSTAAPLMLIDLSSPNNTYDNIFLANYATINLNDALTRVPGVASVSVFGAGQYAMRCWVNPDKLANLKITVPEIIGAIQAQNNVNPAGQIGGNPAPPGQQFTYTVRAPGRLPSAEEFGEIIVRAREGEGILRLKDVARVELGAQNYNMIGRLNGKPAALIAIYQAPGANAVATAAGVRAMMLESKARFPQDLDYIVALDTTLAVNAGIKEIEHTLFEALVLVIIVVYIFLQGVRATLIPLLAVPVSLVGTFIVFPLLGFSINTLSLFGLVLAIGLVVDDAIVVVEAVEHHIERGMSPREATSQAMREVQGPVIAIALVLAAVFIPVAFMSGITGRLYQQFALTIAVSVLISAFNALTLSPALSALLLRPRGEQRGILAWLGARFNRGFSRMTDGYVSINRILVRKLAIPLVLLAGVAAMAVAMGRRMPSGFVPDEDQGYAIYAVQLPDGASLERTKEVYKQVDAVIAAEPGVRTYNDVAGFNFFTRTAAPYLGTGFIGLAPWEQRGQLTGAAIVESLNKKFATIAEARVFAVGPPAIPGISAQGGFSMMLQDRAGQPYEYLAQNVMKFVAEAQRRPELQ